VSGRFDAAYYRRYYLSPRTRVYSRARHARLVAGVVSLVEWFGAPVATVLDVGAGLGWWGAWLARHRPETRVVSTELEADTCEKYGHLQADITTWRLEERFDLVVCQGVLPYLDAGGASAAIENLAAMCEGFLYVEAITREDFSDAIDAERTDLSVNLRPAAFYRQRLRPHFREVGGGLFAARSADLPFYALEVRG
jgi:2-polyprenyl-3-methyl-5-hydroxy-6-metoxy-1,4-benzoquinol methylase